MVKAIRGTKDVLPEDIPYWHRVESVAYDVLTRAAYREIRTPIFEETALFERSIGEATDVVGKEMYTFRDRGDRSLTLRPENTASVVRAFIEHSLYAQGLQRLWYLGPMFRYERPQAGRQRQFHQVGVEVLGSDSPRVDVEVIALATQFLQTLGLSELTLLFNSIGDLSDRQRYREALVAYLTPYKGDLDADSQDRLARNPLRILDAKDKRTREILQQAPSIHDHLSDPSRHRFEQTQQLLETLGIAYRLDPQLVRGLDYYTHTVFEIQSDDLGAQATVCAGGRYDGLVGQLGGPDTPAVGWASGIERLILLLQQHSDQSTSPLDFYLVSRGEAAEPQALAIAHSLRQRGFAAELDVTGSAFGKQLKRADRSGATACLMLGDVEAESNTVQVKWLASGKQEEIKQANLLENVEQLRQQLAAAKEG
ncbi:MAG: histidine--tRNA ligase [Cyanobacteria bacterium P01_A01_bin.135]